MNLNEVEKHVKFDIIFQLLIYIGIGLCFILSIIVILATPAKAASNNINANSHSTCGSSMGSGSYYGAFQNGTCYSRAIGTTYSGQASLVGFWLNYNFQAGKYYTITINFKDNDLLSSTIVDVVRVVDVANNRNEWSSSYNFISKKQFKVYFLAPNNTSSLAFSLASGSGDPITGVSNYGISSIYLEDNDNSDEIINANNQNTQNIINNNNSNAEQTQNAIFDSATSIINEIATRCNNLANMSNFAVSVLCNDSGALCNNGGSITDISSNGNLTFNGNVWSGVTYNSFISVENVDLYLLFKSNVRNYVKVSGYDSSYNFISQRTYSVFATDDNIIQLCSSNVSNVCNSVNTKYVKFSIENQDGNASSFTLTNLRVNTSRGPFCVFGSTISKLDEIGGVLGGIGDNINTTNNQLQNEYNYLTDDTDPTVDSNGIQSTMNMVQTNNPLSYLLTLPTNLLSAIINGLSSNTCQDFEIGKFGHVGRHDLGTYTFKFPCINIEQKIGSNLYNTIDIFVSVGILVLTIVKLYNTISNYLTLGAEDEVKAHSHFLTPMDFLGNILGGNIGGIGNSLSSMSGGL